MNVLVCMPSLLCGTWLAISDLRSRRVPRRIVATGIGAQAMCFVVATAVLGCWDALVRAMVCACAAVAVQLALALVRPGALGLGDVTASALVAFATGWFGWVAFVRWWMVMGILGLAWTGIWSAIVRRVVRMRSTPLRNNTAEGCAVPVRARYALQDGTPFVPVLVIAGTIAVLIP